MKKRVLYFIMALALGLCMALPVQTPVMAQGIGGDKDTVWNPADGHPEDVYLIGQTIYYSLQVRNNSPTEDMIVKISDKIPVEPHTYTEIPGVTITYWWNDNTQTWVETDPDTPVTIPPDGSWNGTFEHTIHEDDVRVHPIEGYNVMVNRLLASGTQGIEKPELKRAKTVRVIQPGIEIVKTVVPAEAQVGQNVTYTFTITNTGDWPLEDITLEDDVVGNLTGELPPNLVLAPSGETGDSYSFPYNYTIQAGDTLPLINEATVEGTAEGFDPAIQGARVSDSDTAEVGPLSDAGIQIKKYVSDSPTGPWDDAESETGPIYEAGSDVYFRFVVTNTGNVILTDVTASDSDFNLTGWTIPDLAPSGDPGDSNEFILGPVTAMSGQQDNTATATGTPPSDPPVSDTDMAHYFGSDRSIDVEKYVWDGGAWRDADHQKGPLLLSTQDPVVFRFEIDNDGNVDLTSVNLTDTDITTFYTDQLCTLPATFPIPTLAPGDPPVTVYGKLAWAAGQHDNTATATGIPPSDPPVFDDDMAHYFGRTPVVGWDTYPVNKLAVLAPWIALAAAIVAGATVFVRRRRRVED